MLQKVIGFPGLLREKVASVVDPKAAFKWRHFKSDIQSAERAVVLSLCLELPRFSNDGISIVQHGKTDVARD